MHTHAKRTPGRTSPRSALGTHSDRLTRASLRPVYATLLATLILFTSAAPASGQVIQIDPYPLDASEGSRKIPDLVNGGETELDWDHIIDIVILGDGYCVYDYDPNDPNDPNACPCGDPNDPPIAVFTQAAYEWYYTLFGGDPNDPNNIGIPPYTYFPEAFRVRAVHKRSDVCASPDRESYYRVKIDDARCGVASMDGWWNNSEDDKNYVFRQRLYAAVDGLDPPVNYALLYDGLDDPPEPDPNSCYQEEDVEFFYPRDRVYSNLVVAMLVRAECSSTNVSGCAPCVCRETNCQPNGLSERVRVAFAQTRQHEFTHAFAYVLDEYIRDIGDNAYYGNPADPSVFTLWNVSFSNERCDLLWPHLAPGGRYNPDLYSPIGRLFMGARCEKGVWHSEYMCLMNGGSNNYECNFDSGGGHGLKTCYQFCFWCEEVVAVKILEKTGQFIRPGDPSDVDKLGRTWYQLWDSELRDGYYWYFDVPGRIAERNGHYADCDGETDPNNCPYFIACGSAEDEILVPECLVGCEIAEYGNAIYVDSLWGDPGNSGSRAEPLDKIEDAVVRANDVCGGLPLVAIKPGSYPPQTITGPVVLVAEACDSVVIGK